MQKNQKLNLSQETLEIVLEKLIHKKDDFGNQYIDYYDVDYVLDQLDKEKLSDLYSKFKVYGQKGVDIVDFIKILLTTVENNDKESLFLVIALIDLFKEVSETNDMKTQIQYNDLTSYICDYFVDKDKITYNIDTYHKPVQKKFNIQLSKIREIDIDPPKLFGEHSNGIKRLNPQKIQTDSQKHNNTSLNQGFYCQDIKKVITLDSLSSHLKIFKINCQLDRIVSVDTGISNDKDIVILSFYWSSRQQRIGATLKDHSLAFWDWSDKFKFQKVFSISHYLSDYQTKIWYLESLNTWVTTDKQNNLNAWDIQLEELKWQLPSKDIIKQNIVEVCELIDIKIIAIASLDKQITFWNPEKRIYLFKIDPITSRGTALTAGVHHMLFNYEYNLLISSGYENNISLFSINPTFLDYSLMGRLVGHMSMVTAVQYIQQSPLVISADDTGCIKVWDIRNFKCIQTMHIGSKLSITQILDISELGKVCFLGSRLNFVEFDQTEIQQQEDNNQMFPIQVEFNRVKEEFIVCTRKDLRFFDLITGKLKKIYTGLVQNEEDEITVYHSINQFKLFILGDQKGILRLFSFQTGECIKELQKQSSEISNLIVDYHNKLILSSSWDSSILLQQETKLTTEKKREILNCHYKKPVSLMEVSIYHNLLVTSSSNDNKIYIYNYEFFKLIGCIDLDQNSEATALGFLNGYNILMICTNKGFIYFVQILINEFVCEYNILLYFDLDEQGRKQFEDKKSIQLQQSEDQENSKSPEKNLDSKGQTINKSPFSQKHRKIIQNQDNQNSQSPKIVKQGIYNPKIWPNKLIGELEILEENIEDQNSGNQLESSKKCLIKKCQLIVAFNNGLVQYHNITYILQNFNLQKAPQAYQRANYNPYRQLKEDFLSIAPKIDQESMRIQENIRNSKKIDISQTKTMEFRAHKDALTTFQYVEIGSKNLITGSLDKFIRIWSQQGKCIANINCNHPLPISWNLQSQRHKRIKKKMYYALKILDICKDKYKQDPVFKKVIKISEFLSQVIKETPNDLSNHSATLDLTQPSLEEINKTKVTLMQDEFSPRDLKFKEAKSIFEKELKGSSLKQMDAKKRLLIAQSQWKQQSENSVNFEKHQKADLNSELDNKDSQINQMNQFQFLNPNYHDKILNRQQQGYQDVNITQFGKDLDYFIQSDKEKQNQYLRKKQKDVTIANMTPKKKKFLQMMKQKEKKMKEMREKPPFSQQLMEQINLLQNNHYTSSFIDSNQNQNNILGDLSKKDDSKITTFNNLQSSKSIDFFNYADKQRLLDFPLIDNSNINFSQNSSINRTQPSFLLSQNKQHVEKQKMHLILKNLEKKVQLSKQSIQQKNHFNNQSQQSQIASELFLQNNQTQNIDDILNDNNDILDKLKDNNYNNNSFNNKFKHLNISKISRYNQNSSQIGNQMNSNSSYIVKQPQNSTKKYELEFQNPVLEDDLSNSNNYNIIPKIKYVPGNRSQSQSNLKLYGKIMTNVTGDDDTFKYNSNQYNERN